MKKKKRIKKSKPAVQEKSIKDILTGLNNVVHKMSESSREFSKS